MIYFRVFNSPMFGGKGSSGYSSANHTTEDKEEIKQIINNIASITEVMPSNVVIVTEKRV